MGDLGSVPGLGRSPGEGKGYPLQYSGLENSMDCIIHGVKKSWTQLAEFHFHFFFTPSKHQVYPYTPSFFLTEIISITFTAFYFNRDLSCPVYHYLSSKLQKWFLNWLLYTDCYLVQTMGDFHI